MKWGDMVAVDRSLRVTVSGLRLRPNLPFRPGHQSRDVGAVHDAEHRREDQKEHAGRVRRSSSLA